MKHLSAEESADFRKKIKIRLLERDMKIDDLVWGTGYSVVTLRNSMKTEYLYSRFMASAIAEALDIDLTPYIQRQKKEKADGKGKVDSV